MTSCGALCLSVTGEKESESVFLIIQTHRDHMTMKPSSRFSPHFLYMISFFYNLVCIHLIYSPNSFLRPFEFVYLI